VKVLYLDCSSGAAGDMLLGALVDAGADRNYITAQLSLLDLHGWELGFEETMRAGLRSLKAQVSVDKESERTYRQVREIVTSAGLDARVAEGTLDAFARLAEAEARVHGTAVDEAHFHEVGATDAIVDVVGSVAALESLDVDRVIASPVAVGSGRARTAHGSLPIPAPATLEILSRAKVPVFPGGEGELTTPTGAAVLAVIADAFGDFPEMTPTTLGYGAGSQEREVPNVLRAVVGKESESIDERIILETNLDDMAPELFPHVINRLLEAGADDAWVTSIVMKKGRPAFTLSALASRDTEPAVARIFFTETTTLGLRTTPAGKRPLERDWILVEIEGTPVQVKIGRFEGQVTNIAPEYEDAVAAARSSDMPLKDVYRMAIDAAQEQLRTSSP
jgi:uncharacterized protein (TIGR00299 family) protein